MSFHSWISLRSTCFSVILRKEGNRNKTLLRKERGKKRRRVTNQLTLYRSLAHSSNLQNCPSINGATREPPSALHLTDIPLPTPDLSFTSTNHTWGWEGGSHSPVFKHKKQLYETYTKFYIKDSDQDVIHHVLLSSLRIQRRNFCLCLYLTTGSFSSLVIVKFVLYHDFWFMLAVSKFRGFCIGPTAKKYIGLNGICSYNNFITNSSFLTHLNIY